MTEITDVFEEINTANSITSFNFKCEVGQPLRIDYTIDGIQKTYEDPNDVVERIISSSKTEIKIDTTNFKVELNKT